MDLGFIQSAPKNREGRKKNVYIVGVEGNIGAGKTTFLSEKVEGREFGENIVVNVLYEVLPENDMLKEFYKDKQKYAKELEMAFQENRIRQLRDHISTISETDGKIHVVFVDRSLYGNYLFALNDCKLEVLNYDDMVELNKQLASIDKQFHPDYILYLETPVDECIRRIEKRARVGENLIERSYLESLHGFHEMLFYFSVCGNSKFIKFGDKKDGIEIKVINMIKEAHKTQFASLPEKHFKNKEVGEKIKLLSPFLQTVEV